jgi:transcriptional regulator
MYIPKAFQVHDQETLFQFIETNPFGILFSQIENQPFATHLPFLLDKYRKETGALLGHMAKQNPHWSHLEGKEVLVVFPGPHAYISASWYKEENTVPTWNYVAVHVYGTVTLLKTNEELLTLLKQTVDVYESTMPDPWKMNVNDPFIHHLLAGIVGFEISIHRIEGKWKLSQNHSQERQQKVIEGLKMTHHYDSQTIAKLMEENQKRGADSVRLPK